MSIRFFMWYNKTNTFLFVPFVIEDSFIKSKLISNIKITASLIIPPTVICLLGNLQYWPLILFGFFFPLIFIVLSICLKYANYNPLVKKNKTSLVLTIMCLFSLLPGFILIPLIYILHQYQRACQRMKYLKSNPNQDWNYQNLVWQWLLTDLKHQIGCCLKKVSR